SPTIRAVYRSSMGGPLADCQRFGYDQDDTVGNLVCGSALPLSLRLGTAPAHFNGTGKIARAPQGDGCDARGRCPNPTLSIFCGSTFLFGHLLSSAIDAELLCHFPCPSAWFSGSC